MSDFSKKIYAFDFDGTLTNCDTLIGIIRFARGTKGLLLCLLRFLPLLVAMKMGLYNNGKAKQRVFAHCFGGMTLEAFNDLCRRYATQYAAIMRPKGVAMLRQAMAEGSKVVVVSASLNNWVEPFVASYGVGFVLGTMPEVREGVLTGRFLTRNCYGKEKVTRLLQLFPDRKQYYLVAFGDSRGDTQLLDFANEAYYKPFRD